MPDQGGAPVGRVGAAPYVSDLLAFGALFLANPDLPERLRTQGPYNTPDRSTFLGGDARGYTHYPVR